MNRKILSLLFAMAACSPPKQAQSIKLANIPTTILAGVTDCLKSMKDIQNFEEVMILGKSEIKTETRLTSSNSLSARAYELTTITTKTVEKVGEFPCQSRVYLFIKAIIQDASDPRTQLFIDQYSQNLEDQNLDAFIKGFEKAYKRYKFSFNQISRIYGLTSDKVPQLTILLIDREKIYAPSSLRTKLTKKLFTHPNRRQLMLETIYAGLTDIIFLADLFYWLNDRANEERKEILEYLFRKSREESDIERLGLIAILILRDNEFEQTVLKTALKESFSPQNIASTIKKFQNLYEWLPHYNKKVKTKWSGLITFTGIEIQMRIVKLILKSQSETPDWNLLSPVIRHISLKSIDKPAINKIVGNFISYHKNPTEACSKYIGFLIYSDHFIPTLERALSLALYSNIYAFLAEVTKGIKANDQVDKNAKKILGNFIYCHTHPLVACNEDNIVFLIHSDHLIETLETALNLTNVDSNHIGQYMKICVHLPTSVLEHQREATDPMRIKFFHKALYLATDLYHYERILFYIRNVRVANNCNNPAITLSDRSKIYKDSNKWDQESFKEMRSSLNKLIDKLRNHLVSEFRNNTSKANVYYANRVNQIIIDCHNIIKFNPIKDEEASNQTCCLVM